MQRRSVRCLRGLFVLGLLPAAIFALGVAAEADSAKQKTKAGYAEEIGASERVNYSGKLRMLSQRVVGTGCNYAAGIDPEKSGPAMEAARDEFDKIVNALEFGDPDLAIVGEEKRKKTRVRIGMLRDLWVPVSEQLNGITNDPSAMSLVETLANDSAPLLEMAKLLVVDLSAQYSDPTAMLQSHAILIDISGRQRMLTQRMSKNVCLINSGINVETARAELEKTAAMFETSLMALNDGMTDAGINPPPNDEIAAGLQVVVRDWNELKPFVEATLSGKTFEDAHRAFVFHGMNRMTGNMNKVVGMYSDASKMGS